MPSIAFARSAFAKRPSSSTKAATIAGSGFSDHGQDFDLDLIVRTTPSSYASFEIVAARLAGAPALITTVDSRSCRSTPFSVLSSSAASLPEDAFVLGLTGHVDDENPLWATTDEDGRIRSAWRRSRRAMSRPASTGFRRTEARSRSARFDRLRDYLKWLVDEGRPVYGVVLPLVFDIDRAHDVEAAEQAGFRGWR